MAIEVHQSPQMAPGAVRLIRRGPASLSGEIEVSIARLDRGSPRYLDPRFTDEQAWGAGERWFRPDPAEGEGLAFGLGPSATWNLKPHMPYLVRIRDRAGAVIEDRMSWPAIRLPSTAPPPGQSHVIAPDAPAGQGEAEDDPLAHFAEMAAEVAPEPPRPARPAPAPRSRRGWIWVAGLFLLLAAIGGAGAYFWAYERESLAEFLPLDGAEDAGAAEDVELTLSGARAFLRTRPAAAVAAGQAGRFADAGQDDAAFLILKYAAREGHGASARKLGDMYDPGSFAPGGVVAEPNADQAAIYFLDAAGVGEAEALHAAGALLKDGKITDQPLAARIRAALEAAATAGDTKAKEFLQ